MLNRYGALLVQFQSTLSMRRATRHGACLSCSQWLFQSTLSMRRATRSQALQNTFTRISIHALHEESDLCQFQHESLHVISIHALHEESDVSVRPDEPAVFISIHALHEESDDNIRMTADNNKAFQSTLSMRRATKASGKINAVNGIFQSTLSMRRATNADDLWVADLQDFNPRSP